MTRNTKYEKGQGLWGLELPPPPPAWLPAELERLYSSPPLRRHWPVLAPTNSPPTCDRPPACYRNKKALCSFCKKNDEEIEVYCSHSLRDTTGLLTCPVLRCYVCPKCGATGDNAHTLTYCPSQREITDKSSSSKRVSSQLKKTKRNSTSVRNCP
ncbi:Nanos 2-like [Homarus americanus]|uniref:Nanos 2-like n=1 Tax=Homarus americanus TaxID=6706 RepID=A0A8J5TIA2_HOMAM|nr:Nanos 2-like [Homarus americanus]